MRDNQKPFITFLKILLPAFYLSIWFLFVWICRSVGLFAEISDTNWFFAFSFLVMFFGMITRSTSWKIGNKFFEISGDSKRHIEYSSHDNWHNSDAQRTGYTIKIDHDDPEVIKDLMTHHHKLETGNKKSS